MKTKTSKQAVRHGASAKAVNPGKPKQLIKRRDGKKETEDKTPTPAPSFLTRAGAARMNRDRNQVLFQNPDSLTCNGFTMALRRTSLSWRLSQRPVVTPKPKKVPPSKKQCTHNIQDEPGVKHSENDSVPSQHATVSPGTENGEQNRCLVEGESQEITQSCPVFEERIEDTQAVFPHLGTWKQKFLGHWKGHIVKNYFLIRHLIMSALPLKSVLHCPKDQLPKLPLRKTLAIS